MSSLIANNVKTNMCLVLIKLFISHILFMCDTVSNVMYVTLITTVSLFDIILCLHPLREQ